MPKLRKFRTLEDKINIGLKIFCCLLILTIIVMGKSLAEYKQEAEVTFIRARVGKFKTNDIQLAMLLDGEEVETPPSKDNYTVDISCDNADGSWDYDEWLAKIGNITSSKVKCEVNFTTPAPTMSEVTATSEKTSIGLSYTASGLNINTTCKYGTSEGKYENEVTEVQNTGCSITGLEMDTLYYYQVCTTNTAGEVCKEGNIKTKPKWLLGEHVKVGDYIYMRPITKLYTLPDDISGCTGQSYTCKQQQLKPIELNTWRIIKVNTDGSVEMVSDAVSSTNVSFYGKTGYKNLVKGLNEIAKQYTDGKHVQSARHIGYNEQTTEQITDETKLNQTSKPWIEGNELKWTSTSSKFTETDEKQGSGDLGYTSDYKLINGVYGTMKSSYYSTKASYWLASRLYSSSSDDYWYFKGTYVSEDGYLGGDNLYEYTQYFNSRAQSHAVRPIVTLKADTEISGGTGEFVSPYYLT